MKKIPIGESDFKSLREQDLYFVDKSLFIKEIFDQAGKITLLPRPRRFGKTLNLSMLRYFFEKTNDNKEIKKLFDGLAIFKESEFKTHFGRYPVIFLSFKDIKEKNFDDAFDKIKSLISFEFGRHSYLLEKKNLSEEEEENFKNILGKKANFADYSNALFMLSKWLFEYHKEKVIILIDEYDTPIHTAFYDNYYEDMTRFFRAFFGAALKDNVNVFKGVLTGILRVSKESIFSGLNNLGVYTILDIAYSDCFGFTEDETFKILEDYNLSKHKKEVQRWYDGYVFGETIIYNPWSILSFASSKNKNPFEAYWANTASNDIIRDLIKKSPQSVKAEFVSLLKDKPIQKQIETATVFRDFEHNDISLYSFLVFCGYLKAFNFNTIDGENYYNLLIPNTEVKLIFKNVIIKWFNESFENQKLKIMLNALTSGDLELFEEILSDFILETLSYFDTAGKNVEKVYQAFLLGLLVHLAPFYEVNSNKESGYGRYDISIVPKDKNKKAIIMELKSIRKKENKDTALNSAVKQIIEKKYETEILKQGITDIIKFGLVFDGKRVWIKESFK